MLRTSKKMTMVAIAAILSSSLAGCGGGGGSVQQSPSNPAPVNPVSQANIELSGADYWHDQGFTGQGTTVALLDAGTDNVNENYDVSTLVNMRHNYTYSKDFANGSNTGYEKDADTSTFDVNNDHGHEMAEVIGASNDVGIAPNANIIHGRITNGTGAAYSDFWQGMKWANDNSAIVANLSFQHAPGGLYLFKDTGAALESNSFAYVHDRTNQQIASDISASGMAVVGAAGNSPVNLSSSVINDATTHSLYYTSIASNILTVGGLKEDLSDKASWSAYPGAKTEVQARYLLAPGENLKITGADGLDGTVSGSSPAAAYVSGSIAMMKSRWTGHTGVQLTQILLDTADKTITGYDPFYHGQGKLDLVAAWSPVGQTSLYTAENKQVPLSAVQVSLPSGFNPQTFQTAIMDSTSRDFEVTVTAQPKDIVSNFHQKLEQSQKPSYVATLGKVGSATLQVTQNLSGNESNQIVGMDGFTDGMFVQSRPMQEFALHNRDVRVSLSTNLYEQVNKDSSALDGKGVVAKVGFENVELALFNSQEDGGYAFYGAKNREAQGVKLSYSSDSGVNMAVEMKTAQIDGSDLVKRSIEGTKQLSLGMDVLNSKDVTIGFLGKLSHKDMAVSMVLPKSTGDGSLYYANERLNQSASSLEKGVYAKSGNMNFSAYSDEYDTNMSVTYKSKF